MSATPHTDGDDPASVEDLAYRRRWPNGAEELLAALVNHLGQPSGTKGRSMSAYRQAARVLAELGVTELDRLLRDYAIESLRRSGPMPLVGFLRGAETKESRIVAVQRWASECLLCEREVVRGELAWISRDEEGRWKLTCDQCVTIDHTWERVRDAYKRAVERDDDPEGLLAAILEQTPRGQREAVEDDLGLIVAARDA